MFYEKVNKYNDCKLRIDDDDNYYVTMKLNNWKACYEEFCIHHEIDNLQENSIKWLDHLAKRIEENINGIESLEYDDTIEYTLQLDAIESIYIFNESNL